MSTTKFLFVLFAFVGFIIVSCSDEPQLPINPTDQSSLGKVIIREFTGESNPTGVIEPGIYRYPDGKILLSGHKGTVYFEGEFLPGDTDPDLLTGPGEVEINGITDPNTGIGHWHGKLTLMPLAPEAAGGQWEFTYHGEATFSLTAWEGGPGWTIPLTEVGHGSGGTLTGMQCRMVLVVSAPPEINTWTSIAQDGVIISH